MHGTHVMEPMPQRSKSDERLRILPTLTRRASRCVSMVTLTPEEPATPIGPEPPMLGKKVLHSETYL